MGRLIGLFVDLIDQLILESQHNVRTHDDHRGKNFTLPPFEWWCERICDPENVAFETKYDGPGLLPVPPLLLGQIVDKFAR